MKDRERKCKSYICEGNCAKGHEGTFNHTCQHCKDYCAVKGSAPRRTDRRRQLKERAERKERRIDF